MALDEAVSVHGPFMNAIPSFGLAQGLDGQGNKKFRRIGDHTAGWTNLAAKRMQRIEMLNTDYIATMIKAMSSAFPGKQITISTADMRAAYRQAALADSDVPSAVKLPVSSASLVFFAVLYLGKQADVPPWESGPDSMQPVVSPLK